ncbi:MAG: hypothetical protein HY423_13645, partial [Candidatus Lambdaproteobacteria bacterium]|nr:hypothetical protein [Candidatus Lambdaproteobacteria bacterium]
TDAGGQAALQADALGWSPRSPLCRWEYLSADLAHAICRVRSDRASRTARGLPALPDGDLPRSLAGAARGDGMAGAADGASGTAGATPCRLYCRIPERRGGQGPEQVELLPLDPATFLAEVQRRVHQRLGAEGVRLFALLMARLHGSRPAEVVDLEPGVLLGQAAEPGEPARAARVRARKLSRLLDLLAEIELRRVLTQGGRSRLEESHFLTVLSRAGELAPTDSPQAAAGRASGEVSRARLMVDPCFYDGGCASLGQPYARLPERLLRLPSGEHPLAVGLYVHLRAAWARVPAGEPVAVTCHAGQLLHEAGFRLGETTRYRMVEALKRELAALQELGFLRRWRIERSPARDVLDDTYRLDAPAAVAPSAGGSAPAEAVPRPFAPLDAPAAQRVAG